MATFAALRLSGEEIACQVAFDRIPSIKCEMNPFDTGDREMWLAGAERPAIERALAVDPTVESHEMVAAGDGRWCYEIKFTGGFEELFVLVDDLEGAVLTAAGKEGVWMVCFGFSQREDVRDIYDQLMEYEFDIEVVRLADSTADDGPSKGRAKQFETLGAQSTKAVSSSPARSP